MFKFLDAYTVRARLFPAVIAAAPALAAIALLISWNKIALSNAIATGALLVVLYALADFARKQGKKIEPGLYAEMGGMPSIVMLRYGDPSLTEGEKQRYRTFLGEQITQPVPSQEAEKANVQAGDSFYVQCGTWLRDKTRDAKKFSILFNENVAYGFRRNLFALKWPALVLNVLVVLVCVGLVWWRWPIDMEDELTTRIIVVLVVAAVHALYIAFVVTKKAVIEAARTYARQLILSCETFMAAAGVKPKGGRAKKAPA
jgi:4-amino-4-deoxy-L-arabinose transferase-like glycosyltransferase